MIDTSKQAVEAMIEHLNDFSETPEGAKRYQLLHHAIDVLRALQDERAATWHPDQGHIWRHKKTGDEYCIIGVCQLEEHNRPAFLYQSVKHGGLCWARDIEEFLDGRFEVTQPPQEGE